MAVKIKKISLLLLLLPQSAQWNLAPDCLFEKLNLRGRLRFSAYLKRTGSELPKLYSCSIHHKKADCHKKTIWRVQIDINLPCVIGWTNSGHPETDAFTIFLFVAKVAKSDKIK